MNLVGRAALAGTIVLIVFCLAAAAAMAQPAQAGSGVTVNVDLLYKIAGLVSIVISITAMLVTVLGNRRKDIDRRFRDGSKRMDTHDLRLQALEQDVRSMPGKDDLHRLELQLSGIAGDMKAISASMVGMAQSINRTEKIVGRHEEHLRGDPT